MPTSTEGKRSFNLLRLRKTKNEQATSCYRYISGQMMPLRLPRINVANVYYHIVMTVYCRKRRRLLIADSVAYIKVVVRRFIIHASRQVNKVHMDNIRRERSRWNLLLEVTLRFYRLEFAYTPPSWLNMRETKIEYGEKLFLFLPARQNSPRDQRHRDLYLYLGIDRKWG